MIDAGIEDDGMAIGRNQRNAMTGFFPRGFGVGQLFSLGRIYDTW